MRIKLSRDIAGAEGVYRAGEVVDLLDILAEGLLGAGYAELVEDMLPPQADTTDLNPEPMAGRMPRRPRARKT